MTAYTNMMYRFGTVLIALSITCLMTAQGIDFLHEGWEDIKKEAAQDDKIIFVDAYATWCGPCKWMSETVFTDAEVADFYNANFINVQLDMEKGEGIDFLAEYNVTAYPTLFFIDGKGHVLHKRVGAIPADLFLEFGKEALDPSKRLATLVRKYKEGNRNSEFLRVYATRLLGAGMEASEAAEAYFAGLSPDEMITKENFELIRLLHPSVDHPQFRTVIDNNKAFATVAGKKAVNGFIKEVCNGDLMRALYYEGNDAFAAKVAEIEALNLNMLDEVVTYGYVNQARKNNDYNQFITSIKKYAKVYAWDNWEVLNAFAWDIYEDIENDSPEYLKLGEKFAKRSVRLDKNYYNTDTYAAILYRQGRYEDAMDWADKAIALAKQAGMDHEETTSLIRKIEEATQ